MKGFPRLIPLSSVKVNPKNPRIMKDARFKKLCDSIRQFPKMMELRPMVVDEQGIALGGNYRRLALAELGYTEIPETWVKRAADLSEEEKRRFIIADNVSFGENDWEQLANEWKMADLEEWGLEIPGFVTAGAEAAEDDYEVPAEIDTIIQPGDFFQIGPHALLCGDARNKEGVAAIIGSAMPGLMPHLMVTDPPYGVSYDADWRNRAERKNGKAYGDRAVGKVENDAHIDWTVAYSLFRGDVAYVWHADRHASEVSANLVSAAFEIINQIIWAKNGMVISRGDYHWQHEPCWYAVRKGKKHHWEGDRSQTTLWQIDRPRKSETGHSTQKPVECMGRPIQNNSKPGELVYDPFVGSGTTMVAAHQLKRICRAIEISPKYCQVVVDRMRRLDPLITITRNGEPFGQ